MKGGIMKGTFSFPATLGLLAALALAAPVATIEASELILYEGLPDQFTIALPEGWTAYDQRLAVTGERSLVGMVIFSPVDFSRLDSAEKQIEAMLKLDTGETACFFVDRHPAPKGSSCKAFSEKATKKVRRMIESDPILAKDRRVIEPLRVETMPLGSCDALRWTARTRRADGNESALEVRAISDGEILYLFSLRNRSEFFEANHETYERSLATLRLSGA
jgi:hypothetical protein